MKKPLLSLLQKYEEVSLPLAMAFVADHFGISAQSQKVMQGCGRETAFQNRLRWARWELKRDGVIETTRRGHFRLVNETTSPTITMQRLDLLPVSELETRGVFYEGQSPKKLSSRPCKCEVDYDNNIYIDHGPRTDTYVYCPKCGCLKNIMGS